MNNAVSPKEARSRFIVSLDFELYWGIRDSKGLQRYSENLAGVQRVIPRLLETFAKYDVCATFATVGFLFFSSGEAALAAAPSTRPSYNQTSLSPYEDLENLASSGPEFFCPDLIRLIQNRPEHEIATHTFSHYYCLEEGQSLSEFTADLEVALRVAGEWALPLQSIVFPRNQINPSYVEACRQLGLRYYRGNERSWLSDQAGANLKFSTRALRILDSYINVSGHHCYSDDQMRKGDLVDLPGSRFLRPFSKRLSFLERLKLARIQASMTHAANSGLTFHLWWHPHNFGKNIDENFDFLEQVLLHYRKLNRALGMRSMTMATAGDEILQR